LISNTGNISKFFFPLMMAGTLLTAQLSGQSTTDLPLMPMPAKVVPGSGSVPIDVLFSAAVSGAGARDSRVQHAVLRTFDRLARQTGIPIRQNMTRDLATATLQVIVERAGHSGSQRLGEDERYSLNIGNGHIRLSADEPLGVLRGIETFLQLVQPAGANAGSGFSIASLQIEDQPRFAWRGLSLDVSRHFIPIDGVLRTLDGMAAVKLNVFHWHLSDDQGFRVESKRYPSLQRMSSDGLYYTQAQVREVIAYARNRGIRVVPEFDMPGHATSWFVAYPNLASGKGPYEIVRQPGVLTALMDPTRESTYRFLNGFIGEMAKLFPDQYFHIGGDEVDPREWKENPKITAFLKKHGFADREHPYEALQAYFNERLLKILTRHHKRMEGWDEILNPDLPKTIVIQSWRGQKSLGEAAQLGFDGILSAGYYLDLMQPASQHYAVDPFVIPPPKGSPPGTPPTRLTPEQQKHILGGEAAMWEEIADAENLDAKLWPRLAAIAERFWSPESVNDVPSMYRRLYVTNHWLGWLGLTQYSNLALMRQRLAGAMPVRPLDEFASVLEPVKGYARQKNYNSFTPLNRLPDAIPPESRVARDFRDGVDRYLAAPTDAGQAAALRKQMAEWAENAGAVRPVLQSNALLAEDIDAADVLAQLCQAGEDALDALASNKPMTPETAQKDEAIVEAGLKPHEELLIQIAPGIQKLLTAAGGH
jgi:hexosaminidase